VDHPDGTNRRHRYGIRVGKDTALQVLGDPIGEEVLVSLTHEWMMRAIAHETIQNYCAHSMILLSQYEVSEDNILV
jgi:hypothetical protein